VTEIENNNNSENSTGQKSKSIATFDLEIPEATQPEHRVYEEISTAATDINIKAISPRTPDRSPPPENRGDDIADSEGISAATGDRDSRQKQMRGA
jgi:hypothetical protein